MTLNLGTILILGLLSALTPLAIDTYLPSIPAIANDINVDISWVQLTISIYLGVYAFSQLIFGPISDAYGRRKVLLFGMGVFLFGTLICIFSNDFNSLMIGRAIQAFGGAAVAVANQSLVKDGLSADQFAKAMSYIMLVMSIAPLIAPILGGIILLVLDWHYIFVFLGLITLISASLFYYKIPETLALENRHPLALKSALSNYYKLLRNPLVMGHILTGSFHFTGMITFITGSAYVYIEFYGVSEQMFGWLFALNMIAMMLATTINTRFIDKMGAKKVSEQALKAVLVCALIMATLTFFDKPPLALLIIPIIIFVGCLGILGGGLMAGAMQHSGNLNGSVTALAGTTRFAMGAVGGILVSALHNDSFVPMVGIMAACGLLSFSCYHLFGLGTVKSTSNK